MAWWQRQFGSSTRGKLVALLRTGPKSVDQLSDALGVTQNAVRAQLAALARDGVATSVGARHAGTVGKPATLYAIAEPAETAFSGAYPPTLATLVSVLGERLPPEELESVLGEVGRRLAPASRVLTGPLEPRVQQGAAALVTMGAMVDVSSDGDAFVIAGHGCPLGVAVAAHPATCRTVEQLLAMVTGARIREQCSRDGASPKCTFHVSDRGGD